MVVTNVLVLVVLVLERVVLQPSLTTIGSNLVNILVRTLLLLRTLLPPSRLNPQTSGYTTPLAMHILHALKNVFAITANPPSQNRLLVSAGWKFRHKEKERGSWWTNSAVLLC